MLRVEFRWSDDSRRWIDQLDTLPRRLFHGMRLPVQQVLRLIVAEARGAMPTFEMDMWRDLRVLGIDVGNDHITGHVGFSDTTVMPEEESVDKSTAPFHYPWGKHDGIEPHKVWLWSRARDRGRAKLIRWGQAHGVISTAVPEDGSAEEIRAALPEGQPPWLWVAPASNPFLYDALDSVGDRVMAQLDDRLGLMWRGHSY